LVDERLTECLNILNWTMLIISLENLDAFRESYGFVASDDVLRAVSLMIHNARKEIGNPDDFLGHLGTTDFVLITTPDKAANLKDRIHSRLELSLDYFYPIKDREQMGTRTKRLIFKIGILENAEREYSTLDGLKMTLLRRKQ